MFITPQWSALRPHKQQSRLYRCTKRFAVVAAGRGSGKSEIARRRLVRELPIRIPGNSNPEYFYGLPTFAQAKRVAWKRLLELIPREWIEKKSETDLLIKTVFGSDLYVVGFDRRERVEGTQWVGGIIDESSDEPPGLFDLSIEPALSRWNGWCWRIGVPKRYGVGAVEFKAAYDLGLTGEDPETETFHWESDTVLSPEEIARLKTKLDIRDFNEQYRARFEVAGGLVHYQFNKDFNVSEKVVYQPDRTIVVGSDFNVNPMSWVIGHRADDGIIIFDEIFLRNTNTNETLNELKTRYGSHSAGWEFTGDASGNARKSSAYTTDYIQIKNYANENLNGPVKMLYLSSNPARANRFASVNALLCNAKNERKLFINPRCKRLIADLESRAYKEDSREPNDYGDVGHMTDALGYICYRFFPLRIVQDVPPTVIINNGNRTN